MHECKGVKQLVFSVNLFVSVVKILKSAIAIASYVTKTW